MHASELAPTWKERLLKLSTHLQKELGLREKELATMAEKAQKAKTEAEKRSGQQESLRGDERPDLSSCQDSSGSPQKEHSEVHLGGSQQGSPG